VVLPPVAGESLVGPLEHEPQDVDDAAAASFPFRVLAAGSRRRGNVNVFGRRHGSWRISAKADVHRTSRMTTARAIAMDEMGCEMLCIAPVYTVRLERALRCACRNGTEKFVSQLPCIKFPLKKKTAVCFQCRNEGCNLPLQTINNRTLLLHVSRTTGNGQLGIRLGLILFFKHSINIDTYTHTYDYSPL
jgi:hypothetical protein